MFSMGEYELGLIGHPLEHSMSPPMHHASFEKLGLPYRYGLFDLVDDELEGFIFKARDEMIGLNVTIPHKVSVIPFLNELSKEAELIGAVNTVKFDKGKAFGFNTDGVGCMMALAAGGVDVAGKNVLILGAGGAARAISFQATLDGAEVFLSNREEEKQMVVDLADEIARKTGNKCTVVDMDAASISAILKDVDVLIHATPVGMHPNEGAVIIPPEIIPANVAVMDIVYNPIETRLLREVKNRGCNTINGVGMLVNQGAAAEKIWLGVDPPVEVMEKIVCEKLGGR